MFTGIVQRVGRVAAAEPRAGGMGLSVDVGRWVPRPGGRPSPGDSICVSGVCLTLTRVGDTRWDFDVVAETLARTTLGDWAVGTRVNLEPAAAPTQPLGGHFMQGHVDGIGVVAAAQGADRGAEQGADRGTDRDAAPQRRLVIQPPAGLAEVIVEKGSVAVDGVSLTVASVSEDRFALALIPTTLDQTTLGELAAGGRVNLEADIIAKTVVHAMRRWAGGDAPPPGAPGPGPAADQAVTMAGLVEAGFASARGGAGRSASTARQITVRSSR